MHTDGWRLVELEDGSSSSSDPEDQVLTESLNFSQLVGGQRCKPLPPSAGVTAYPPAQRLVLKGLKRG